MLENKLKRWVCDTGGKNCVSYREENLCLKLQKAEVKLFQNSKKYQSGSNHFQMQNLVALVDVWHACMLIYSSYSYPKQFIHTRMTSKKLLYPTQELPVRMHSNS
jgi:hypothetical protein